MPGRQYARTAGAVLTAAAARDAYKGAKSYFSKKKKAPRRSYRMIKPGGGFRPGTGVSKRTLVSNIAGQSLASRTLYSRDLTWIDHASTGNQVNARQRDIVNVRGFKINMKMRALNPTGYLAGRSLMFHWAVVVPRFSSSSGIPGNTQVDPITTVDFFRGNGENRSIDFQNSLSGMEVNVLPINSDLYTVLKRGSRFLNPTPADNSVRPQAFADVSVWCPYNRQVRYDNETSTATEPVAVSGRAMLVYWCEYHDGLASGFAPSTGLISLDHHIVTYWKEP